MITYTLKSIAQNLRFNPDELIEFALRNPSDYGVEESNKEMVTSANFYYHLINDFFDYKLEMDNRYVHRMLMMEIRRKSLIHLIKYL